MPRQQPPGFTMEFGDGPIVATAIHHGHALRPELQPFFTLTDDERRREEDPVTAAWTKVAPSRLVFRHSRFEVDVNRPRDRAVYLSADDAWGLDLWSQELPPDAVEHSLQLYDAFYASLQTVLEQLIEQWGQVVLLDIHTYNHRRAGPEAPPADPEENPEVNIGTGTLDRSRWGTLIDRFIDDFRRFPFLGRQLDVRENVRFRGGHMCRWIHDTFPEDVCALAIEVKKFFMDEWTGEVDEEQHAALGKAFQSTIPGLRKSLQRRVTA